MTTKAKLPGHLTRKTKTWATAVLREYDLSPTQLELLILACEMRDAAESARLTVASEGAIVLDRFGQSKENPSAKLQRDCAMSCSRLLREIGLAVDDTDDSRPPRIGG
jgi:hypothetical protein